MPRIPEFHSEPHRIFSMFHAIRTMMDLGMTIEAVDALTGPVVGHPKSASFKTADLVGVDIVLHVAENVYEGVVDDEKREMFKPPEFIRKMAERNLLGNKTKQGFYKRVKGQDNKNIVLSLNYNTLEHTPQQEVKFPPWTRLGTSPVRG